MVLSSCQQVEVEPKVIVDTSKEVKVNETVTTAELPSEKDKNEATQASKESEESEEHLESKAVEEPIEALEIHSGWAMQLSEMMVEVPFEPSTYTVKQQPLSIEEQYESIINKDQYKGFTDGQIEMIKDNGFVVMSTSSQLKMHTFYEYSEYMDLPIFISSDAILHMYHTFYSESMKTLELVNYYSELQVLTKRLLNQAEVVYDNSDGELKAELAYVYAYIAIGASLLELDINLPQEVQTLVDGELTNIKGLGVEHSEFYDKDVDYSQYTVRGHYTLHEDLGKFFRTMMWYGQTGFQLTKESQGQVIIQYEQVARSLMFTELIFEDSRNIESYNMIYGLTKLYSGYSDDLNIYDMRDFIDLVYGEDHDYKLYIDENYRGEIENAIGTLRSPGISASATLNVAIPAGLQFRLMGQRYTLDADIMQNLMAPIQRPVPTAFDVLSAFDHPVAEEILYEYYETNQNWEGYDETLELMKNKVNNYDQWQSNFYNGWLWAIDSAATSYEDEMDYPYFMQTRAWSHKNIISALGSYAQLKHDNILYGKQPMAEMGGAFYEDQEYHYVEPNVELYEKLLWLTSYTRANLESRQQFTDEMIQPISEMESMLQILVDVAKKELAGEEVTDDEFNALSGIGGLIDYLGFTYSRQLVDHGFKISRRDSDASIADVATIFAPGKEGFYLEEAVGLPKDIYTVCYVNGDAFLAKGTVFSYYEFLWPERLTDEAWAGMVGLTKEEHEDYNIITSGQPQINQLEIMPWMSSYISDEPNSVETEMMEVRWGD